MEDFNSETDSDYTSYWRDWVSFSFLLCFCFVLPFCVGHGGVWLHGAFLGCGWTGRCECGWRQSSSWGEEGTLIVTRPALFPHPAHTDSPAPCPILHLLVLHPACRLPWIQKRAFLRCHLLPLLQRRPSRTQRRVLMKPRPPPADPPPKRPSRLRS